MSKTHNKLLEKIVKRLDRSKNYKYILKNINYDFFKGNKIYHNSQRIASEIDLVALREVKLKDYWLVFEIKTENKSKARNKAELQLEKHKQAFGSQVDKMYRFLVIKDKTEKGYNIQWIK